MTGIVRTPRRSIVALVVAGLLAVGCASVGPRNPVVRPGDRVRIGVEDAGDRAARQTLGWSAIGMGLSTGIFGLVYEGEGGDKPGSQMILSVAVGGVAVTLGVPLLRKSDRWHLARLDPDGARP